MNGKILEDLLYGACVEEFNLCAAIVEEMHAEPIVSGQIMALRSKPVSKYTLNSKPRYPSPCAEQRMQ